jgi:uncharacterized protein YecE (DUF72 family)
MPSVTPTDTHRQPKVLYVGCAMWAHRPWVGTWLPSSTRSGRELVEYSRICTAVEGNTSFYALPPERSVARWCEQAPASFRFLFKLPRTVTHDRRLRDAGDLVAEFLERIGPLGERIGPISIQLPASFGPSDLDTLRTFLAGLPRAFPWSVELRHPAFVDHDDSRRRANETLARAGVDRVILDSRSLFAGPCETEAEIETFRVKPRLAVRPMATGKRPVVGLIGQTDALANHPFWEPWIAKVVEWLEAGLTPTVFTHTPDNAAAPGLARWFHAAVAARLPTLAALPDSLADSQAEMASPPVGATSDSPTLW